MSQKSEIIKTLDEYFYKKGRILDIMEYKYSEDVPIKPAIVKKIFGSWGRLEKIIMARRERLENPTNVDEVLAARNAAEIERQEVVIAEDPITEVKKEDPVVETPQKDNKAPEAKSTPTKPVGSTIKVNK